MRIESQLQIVYWPVSKLTRYIRNPRKNDAVVDRIRASIREYGFVVPILAKADATVIDGDLRLKGAIKEGMAEVPVIVCDGWSEAQVKAFRIMVNRSAQELAETNKIHLLMKAPPTGRFATRSSRLLPYHDIRCPRLIEAGD